MKTREDEVEELVALMQQAAEKASRAVLESLGREESGRVIGRNPSATPTRIIDKVSEDILLAEMKESRIPLLAISEERGIIELGREPRYVLVVDPLDGTTNALHGIPFFAVSLGLAELTEAPSLKDMLAGVVRDITRGVNYLAVKKQGFKGPNSARSTAQEQERMGNAKLLISLYAYGGRTADRAVLNILESFLVRTLGSVSLEMCLLARGSLDAFVDIRNLTRVVDVAAALVILQESGCTVSDAKGEELENPLTASEGLALVAARSQELHEHLIEMVNPST